MGEVEGIAAVLNLILQGAMNIQKWASLVTKARSENRDISRAELDALLVEYNTARNDLLALIEAKK